MATPLLEHSPVVVEQKRKLFDMRNQYRIFDETRNQLGLVEQVDQAPLAFLARLGTDLDVALPMSLEIGDTSGTPVLRLDTPWFNRTFKVSSSGGIELDRSSSESGSARRVSPSATGWEPNSARSGQRTGGRRISS